MRRLNKQQVRHKGRRHGNCRRRDVRGSRATRERAPPPTQDTTGASQKRRVRRLNKRRDARRGSRRRNCRCLEERNSRATRGRQRVPPAQDTTGASHEAKVRRLNKRQVARKGCARVAVAVTRAKRSGANLSKRCTAHGASYVQLNKRGGRAARARRRQSLSSVQAKAKEETAERDDGVETCERGGRSRCERGCARAASVAARGAGRVAGTRAGHATAS